VVCCNEDASCLWHVPLSVKAEIKCSEEDYPEQELTDLVENIHRMGPMDPSLEFFNTIIGKPRDTEILRVGIKYVYADS